MKSTLALWSSSDAHVSIVSAFGGGFGVCNYKAPYTVCSDTSLTYSALACLVARHDPVTVCSSLDHFWEHSTRPDILQMLRSSRSAITIWHFLKILTLAYFSCCQPINFRHQLFPCSLLCSTSLQVPL